MLHRISPPHVPLNQIYKLYLLQALTLAMTLHEKGRIALKNKEVSQALLLLLEADKEFR